MPDNVQYINVMDSIERLLRAFRFERFLYLLTATVSAGIFLYAAWRFVQSGTVSTADLVTIFGASGLSAASSAGIGYFLKRAFELLEIIVRSSGGQTP